MNIKFSNAILFISFGALIFIYFFTLPFTTKHNRYTLYFVNMRTGQVGTEIRFLPKKTFKAREVELVEELMLGPMNHDYYDFMKKNTSYHSCFVDNHTLYVSFPKSLLPDVQERMPFEQFYTLFEKNIFANCPNIKEVCLFLDGVQVYEHTH